MVLNNSVFVFCLLFLVKSVYSTILCQDGFCRNYGYEVGCATPAIECRIDNATHTGLWLPSPTTCNCCEYCLPVFGEGRPCSVGGPGIGVTVGRCGDGLTCVAETDGNYCRRMTSKCHDEQDDYDARHASGQAWAMEMRPLCDGKGQYAPISCVPAHTCFCQSEEGERLFGEVLYVGPATVQNTQCGCSRLQDKIRKTIRPGVPYPVVGPRCTSDGDFNPIQCVNTTCHCVNRVTGLVLGNHPNHTVDLDEHPISRLACYDPAVDLFPRPNEVEPPYNYTSPCFEEMRIKIGFLQESEEDGFNVDFFSTVPECLPDGTFGRVIKNENGSKICVDEWGEQLEDFKVKPDEPGYESMDCKCAQTRHVMSASIERPICCSNGNYRPIQCRRGSCRCVDSEGRQVGRESSDVTLTQCFTEDWGTC